MCIKLIILLRNYRNVEYYTVPQVTFRNFENPTTLFSDILCAVIIHSYFRINNFYFQYLFWLILIINFFLAYHGVIAEKHSFNIISKKTLHSYFKDFNRSNILSRNG